MWLELAITSLISVEKPDLLGKKEQNRVVPEMNLVGESYKLTYKTEIDGSQYTINSVFGAESKLSDKFSIGYENRYDKRLPSGRGGEFLYLKFGTKIEF